MNSYLKRQYIVSQRVNANEVCAGRDGDRGETEFDRCEVYFFTYIFESWKEVIIGIFEGGKEADRYFLYHG